jgi:RimJ/RimL family protein N-acetyltransferase
MEIPENTIQAFARNFHREARIYGFSDADCLRFVNAILDLILKNDQTNIQKFTPLNWSRSRNPRYARLPITTDHFSIRDYDHATDQSYFREWLQDEYGRLFLASRLSMRRTEFYDVVHDPSNIIGVITLPDGLPIGAVAFLEHDTTSKKAELRKLIGNPDYRAKGYAKMTTRLWIEYGLFGLGLKKIYLHTLNTNIRNIRLNEELGFTVEGILHNEVCFDGIYRDVLRMSLWLE